MEIPKGHQTVMPYLMLEGAARFTEFVRKVFDAEQTHGTIQDGQPVRHAEVQIGGSTIMYADGNDQWKSQTANLFIYVPDVDITYSKALEEGATTVMELSNQDYGRTCGVKDPFGNTWWITSTIK